MTAPPLVRSLALALACACVAAFPSVPAVAGTLEGRVLDQETGLPLARTSVRLADPVRTALTDSLGRFTLRDVPHGFHWIELRCSYHAPGTFRVQVPAAAPIEWRLQRNASPRFEEVVRPDRFMPPPPKHEGSTVDVRVLDAAGHPLTGVMVEVPGTGPGGRTDATGRRRLEHVPLGRQVVLVRSSVHEAQRDTIESRERGTRSLTVRLEALPAYRKYRIQMSGDGHAVLWLGSDFIHVTPDGVVWMP